MIIEAEQNNTTNNTAIINYEDEYRIQLEKLAQ